MAEYLLIVEHNGTRHTIEGVSISGIRDRAKSEYPGCTEFKFESKGANNG